MRFDIKALIESVRRSDPKAWLQLQDVLQTLSRHVTEADRIGGFPDGLWTQISISFLNRLNLPSEYGGSVFAATGLRRVIFYELVARVCPALAIGLPGPGLSAPPVLFQGTEPQKHEYFRHFLSTERPIWGAFAMTEPQSGSDATEVRTVAVPTGEGYRISGKKCFIGSGGRADVLVVFANIAPERGRFGIRAFIVDKSCPGFTVERRESMLGLRACQLAELSFKDCYVQKEAMLGHTGLRGPKTDGFTAAQSAWDYMRPVLAAVINGASSAILKHAELLAKSGASKESSHAAGTVASELARLRAALMSARLLALRAAWKYDNGFPIGLDASLAKASASNIATEVSATLSRLFPLSALTSGDPIEKFTRDAKAFDILEGTGDMQRLMIARGFDKMLISDSRQ